MLNNSLQEEQLKSRARLGVMEEAHGSCLFVGPRTQGIPAMPILFFSSTQHCQFFFLLG